jgi:hypothetical protein
MKNLFLLPLLLMLISPSLIKGSEEVDASLKLCKDQYSNSIDAISVGSPCIIICIGKKGTKSGSSYLGTVNWNQGCGNRATCLYGQCVGPREWHVCMRNLPSVKRIDYHECNYECVSLDENKNVNGSFWFPNPDSEMGSCGFKDLWHCKDGRCVE